MTTSSIQNLNQWFTALAPKDRLALTILGLFLSLLLVIFVLILPAHSYADKAAEHQRQRAELLTWMQANASAARMIAGQNVDRPNPDADQSILSLSSKTAQTHNISFKRVEPFADDGLRIWLDNTSFNALLIWLTQLQDQYGIGVLQANIDRGKSSGQVSAKLELLRTQ